MLMDMFCGIYIQSALSFITTLSGDQSTVNQQDEDLEKKKKMNSKLLDKATKLEDNKTKLLKANNELKLATKDKEYELKKVVISLKNELNEKKKQIETLRHQVQLSIDKLKYPPPMYEKHNKKCDEFRPLWDESKQYEDEENAE